MKKLFAILCLIVGVAAVPRVHAQTVVTTLTMIGTNPIYDEKGSLTSASVQGQFLSTTSDGYSKTIWVNWDGTDKTHFVTIDGMKLSYYQVTIAAGMIADIERQGGAGTQKSDYAIAAAAAQAAADAKAAADAAAKAKANSG